MNINYIIFQFINQLAGENQYVDFLMVFASKYLSYAMVATICIIFLLGIVKQNKQDRYGAIHTFLLMVIGLSINALLGAIFYFPRPFVNHQVHLLYAHSADSSFPSDHATTSMSMAAGLRWIDKPLSWLFVALSIWIGFSRIYVGHHYPLDIISSYGIVWIVYFLYHKFLEIKITCIFEAIEQWSLKHITKRISGDNKH